MGHYFVVAHQTATSPVLVGRLRRIAREDRRSEFTVLVPATHPKHLVRRAQGEPLFTWDERESHRMAARRAEEARATLEREGLRVRDAVVGDDSPLLAIEDQLRSEAEVPDGIVLSTLPVAESRWARMSLREQAERRFPIPVLHVCEGRENVAWSLPAEPTEPAPWRRRAAAVSTGRGLLIVVILAVAYLLGSALLALTVDRRFFVNDALALIVFAVFIAGLYLIERGSRIARDHSVVR